MEPIVKILLAYAAKQYGMEEDAVAELLFEKNSEDEKKLDYSKLKTDALDTLLGKDKTRVAGLKVATDKTEIYNKAFADAKKDILPKEEKKLAAKFGIEYNEKTTKLDSLVDAIVEQQVASAEVPADKITEDIVKKHPTYLNRERELSEANELLKTTHETDLEKLKTSYAKDETFRTVQADILTHFDNLNPILSTTATKAAKQRTAFASKFSDYDFEKPEGSKTWLVSKNGKRLEDEHGNPVALKNLVATTADEIYDFKKQDDLDGPGNKGGAGGTVKVPTSHEEYITASLEATTAEERQAVDDAYVAAGGKIN